MEILHTRKQAQKHVDKKLQRRLLMYFVISLILIGVVCYEVITGLVGVSLALLGVVIGLIGGVLSARMFHISWDHDAQKIVSSLDRFGIIILVFYIAFALSRGMIIGHFIHGSSVGGVSIAIATGIMIGRAMGTRGRIVKILKEQDLL